MTDPSSRPGTRAASFSSATPRTQRAPYALSFASIYPSFTDHPSYAQHIGQGANQAIEDVGRLVDLLETHNPSGADPSSATLAVMFGELERERIPRTAELVKRARAQGEIRVVSGTEACIKRNNFYRELLKDEEAIRRRLGA